MHDNRPLIHSLKFRIRTGAGDDREFSAPRFFGRQALESDDFT